MDFRHNLSNESAPWANQVNRDIANLNREVSQLTSANRGSRSIQSIVQTQVRLLEAQTRISETTVAPTYSASINTTAANSGTIQLGSAIRPPWARRAIVSLTIGDSASGSVTGSVNATVVHGPEQPLGILLGTISSVINLASTTASATNNYGCIVQLGGTNDLYTAIVWSEASSSTGTMVVNFTPMITWLE